MLRFNVMKTVQELNRWGQEHFPQPSSNLKINIKYYFRNLPGETDILNLLESQGIILIEDLCNLEIDLFECYLTSISSKRIETFLWHMRALPEVNSFVDRRNEQRKHQEQQQQESRTKLYGIDQYFENTPNQPSKSSSNLIDTEIEIDKYKTSVSKSYTKTSSLKSKNGLEVFSCININNLFSFNIIFNENGETRNLEFMIIIDGLEAQIETPYSNNNLELFEQIVSNRSSRNNLIISFIRQNIFSIQLKSNDGINFKFEFSENLKNLEANVGLLFDSSKKIEIENCDVLKLITDVNCITIKNTKVKEIIYRDYINKESLTIIDGICKVNTISTKGSIIIRGELQSFNLDYPNIIINSTNNLTSPILYVSDKAKIDSLGYISIKMFDQVISNGIIFSNTVMIKSRRIINNGKLNSPQKLILDTSHFLNNNDMYVSQILWDVNPKYNSQTFLSNGSILSPYKTGFSTPTSLDFKISENAEDSKISTKLFFDLKGRISHEKLNFEDRNSTYLTSPVLKINSVFDNLKFIDFNISHYYLIVGDKLNYENETKMIFMRNLLNLEINAKLAHFLYCYLVCTGNMLIECEYFYLGELMKSISKKVVTELCNENPHLVNDVSSLNYSREETLNLNDCRNGNFMLLPLKVSNGSGFLCRKKLKIISKHNYFSGNIKSSDFEINSSNNLLKSSRITVENFIVNSMQTDIKLEMDEEVTYTCNFRRRANCQLLPMVQKLHAMEPSQLIISNNVFNFDNIRTIENTGGYVHLGQHLNVNNNQYKGVSLNSCKYVYIDKNETDQNFLKSKIDREGKEMIEAKLQTGSKITLHMSCPNSVDVPSIFSKEISIVDGLNGNFQIGKKTINKIFEKEKAVYSLVDSLDQKISQSNPNNLSSYGLKSFSHHIFEDEDDIENSNRFFESFKEAIVVKIQDSYHLLSEKKEFHNGVLSMSLNLLIDVLQQKMLEHYGRVTEIVSVNFVLQLHHNALEFFNLNKRLSSNDSLIEIGKTQGGNFNEPFIFYESLSIEYDSNNYLYLKPVVFLPAVKMNSNGNRLEATISIKIMTKEIYQKFQSQFTDYKRVQRSDSSALGSRRGNNTYSNIEDINYTPSYSSNTGRNENLNINNISLGNLTCEVIKELVCTQFTIEDFQLKSKIRGDGNCLFRSILNAMDQNEEDHFRLRTEIWETIRNDEQLSSILSLTEEEEIYRDGVYAGYAAISAYSKMKRAIFIIYDQDVADGKHGVNLCPWKIIFDQEISNQIPREIIILRYKNSSNQALAHYETLTQNTSNEISSSSNSISNQDSLLGNKRNR